MYYNCLEVYTGPQEPENPGTDPGLDQVQIHVLDSQSGLGQVPFYYTEYWVCSTLCVISDWIWEDLARILETTGNVNCLYSDYLYKA